MHVCLLSMEWPPYGCGIGTYMFNLARGLVDAGHRVTVVTHDKAPIQVPGVEVRSVPVPEVRGGLAAKVKRWRWEPHCGWSERVARAMASMRETAQWDIVETAEYGAWGRHLAAVLDIPIVVRCHNPARVVWAGAAACEGRAKPVRMPFWVQCEDARERRVVVGASGVTSPSAALANHLALQWIVPRSRFHVLPNPIDAGLFCPADADDAQREREPREILYTGRLEHNKGVFDLVRSVKPLLDDFKDVRVRFVGMDRPVAAHVDPSCRMATEFIRSMVDARHHDRLIFDRHMPISELMGRYQHATCFAMPTRAFESFSYTLVEAMACGCPVVATHCGGPTEIVTQDEDGLLVAPGDETALSEALRRLLENADFRAALARNARQTVERKYDISAVIPGFVKLYENLIAEQQRP